MCVCVCVCVLYAVYPSYIPPTHTHTPHRPHYSYTMYHDAYPPSLLTTPLAPPPTGQVLPLTSQLQPRPGPPQPSCGLLPWLCARPAGQDEGPVGPPGLGAGSGDLPALPHPAAGAGRCGGHLPPHPGAAGQGGVQG